MKKFEKRVISVALIATLVATMVTLSPKMQDGAVSHAAAVNNTGIAVRGAVEELTQLPQYGVKDWQNLQRGTEKRPFVVLEIVPYKEFAEIGYMIGGCEPVNINRMLLNPNALDAINNMGYLDIKRDVSIIFQDEILYMYRNDAYVYEELSTSFASDVMSKLLGGNTNVNWESGALTVYGYYERVADGTGNFDITITPIIPDEPDVSDGDTSGGDATDSDVTDGDATDGDATNDAEENNESVEPQSVTGEDDTLQLTSEIVDNVPVVDVDEIQDDHAAASSEEVIDDGNIVLDDSDMLEDGDPADENTVSGGEIVTLPAANVAVPMINNDTSVLSLDTAGSTGCTVEITKNIGQGNWVWHSESTTDNGTYLKPQTDGTYDITPDITEFYTSRTRDMDNQTLQLGRDVATEYKNKELFLTQSMGLGDSADDEKVKSYSIVVKTITPAELNTNSSWIDYADLIYLQHTNTRDNLTEFYANYNQLWNGGKAYNASDYNRSNAFADNDLDWPTALKLYEKITANSNYAGIILDETVFKGGADADNCIQVTGKNIERVDIKIYDWNFNEYFDDWGKPVKELYGASENRDAVGCNNNIYKMSVMLLCMDSNLFRQLYLNESNPLIDKNGNYIKQTGKASSHWTMTTFLLVPPNMVFSQYGYSLYQYWNSAEAFKAYHFCSGPAAVEHWVQDHVFVCKGNEITDAGNYQSKFGVDSRFTDFSDYCKQDGNHDPTVAEAVKYILNAGDSGHYGEGMTLNVLDIEPSVGLDSKSQPDWTLTENYLRWLIPSFAGKINITHQTTAHFIGMAEDLNAKYQMIFMGLDANAYNLRTKQVGNRQMQVPAWNDKAMYEKGYIYVHTGDMVFSTEYYQSRDGGKEIRSRSVKWIANKRGTIDTWTEQFLRLPGNDISKLKKAELESFMKSGRPVVAEQYLYDLQYVIDPYSVVHKFVKESKDAKLPLFSVSQAEYIDKTVRASSSEAVTFTQLPPEYNGSTPDYSATITNPNYLPTNSGRAYMAFGFNVAEEGYSYRVYVDQDKNSKFDENEIIFTRTADVGANEYRYQVGVSTVGLVQWKIEVYKTNNPAIRFVKTGCSAVRKTSSSTASSKKKVNVLQIMPFEWEASEYDSSTANDGRLNLEQNELFIKYSKDLADYDLKIHAVTWAEFSECFSGRGFSYDYTKSIEDGVNPVNLGSLGTLRDGSKLDSYNMIVMGFGDTYGGTNLSNVDGQVDYLRYFLDLDKSILFTHDLSSLYNVPDTTNNKQIFGFTVNALMRDLMGMNRYGTVSIMANQTGDPNEANRLIEYQSKNADKYDTLEWSDNGQISVAAHGYTYYSLKRLGWDNTTNNINYTVVGNDGRSGYYEAWVCRMPYKYMRTSPQGYQLAGNGTGFNNANDITTKASKVNEGQITTYPYKISDTLTVSRTHGQWYALSPEDPDVTVWYCLATDDSAVVKADMPLNEGEGSSITYGVSPNDAMNNYYIYSKGNIFYSGVGHSTIGKNVNDPQDMEVKLFINTMIAAANSSYDPPIVEIDNEESVLTGSNSDYLEYNIEMVQNFDELGAQYFSSNVTYGPGDTYTVEFTPVDYNLVTTELTCTIQVGTGGDYITSVRNASGAVINADPVTHEFKFNNRQNYTLTYQKSYLNNDDTRTIIFKIKNDRVEGYGTTDLRMSLQPLFPLD